jgi:hypothetical protein
MLPRGRSTVITTIDLLERLGPLDLTRPRAEINSRFVNLRAAVAGIATPVRGGEPVDPAYGVRQSPSWTSCGTARRASTLTRT